MSKAEINNYGHGLVQLASKKMRYTLLN